MFNSRDAGYDFLPLRCWIGLWTTFLILLVVMFDLSALVRYITRFTEESFACLIAIIFIYEAFKKQIHIMDEYGINPHPEIPISTECVCLPPNMTEPDFNVTLANFTDTTVATLYTNITKYSDVDFDPTFGVWDSASNATIAWVNMTKEQCTTYNGTLEGDGCVESHYYPDVFFLSCILFLGTYTIAMTLKDFKTSPYFPTFVRTALYTIAFSAKNN